MSHFNVAGLKEQLLELHETMNEPDFWNDLKRSTEVSRKVRITENKVEHYEKLCQRADDVDTTMELAEEMQDTDLLAEAGEEIKKLQSDLEELRLESLLRGDYDSNNCYLSLHAGVPAGSYACFYDIIAPHCQGLQADAVPGPPDFIHKQCRMRQVLPGPGL